MFYTLQKLWNEPIILQTVYPGYDLDQDVPHAAQQVFELLDTMGGPAYIVADARALRKSLGDLVETLGLVNNGTQAAFHHPHIREVVVVAVADIEPSGIETLVQAQNGGPAVTVVGTLDEALRYVRARVA
jgi:hypothetical protein